MVKIAKNAILKAEKDWNLVFTIKKWDEYLPKDVVTSQEALANAKTTRPKSLNDKRNVEVTDDSKQRVFTSDGTVDTKPSQVEFLYSLWEKEPKSKPPTLKSIKVRQPSIQEGTDLGKLQGNEGSNPNMSQTSSFYQINHPRNKLTNSYNYVVRKANLQFVCREKEAEVVKKPEVKPEFVQPSIDDELFARVAPMPIQLPVNKVDLTIDGPGNPITHSRGFKNARLAKIEIK